MGFTTHLYKCGKCNVEILYTSKQSHPTLWHRCKLKPVKQVEKKDFEHINLVLNPNNDINPEDKRYQYEYWEKRINLRIEYLTPLINECNQKGYCLATLSKELHEEWLQLHEVKRFYKFS
jgi:hypothetical protein